MIHDYALFALIGIGIIAAVSVLYFIVKAMRVGTIDEDSAAIVEMIETFPEDWVIIDDPVCGSPWKIYNPKMKIKLHVSDGPYDIRNETSVRVNLTFAGKRVIWRAFCGLVDKKWPSLADQHQEYIENKLVELNATLAKMKEEEANE